MNVLFDVSFTKCIVIINLLLFAIGSELSLLVREVDTRFSELYQAESLLCSHEAVAEFIDQCQEKGADRVSTGLRLRSAVKLSICEFKEANVEYPEICVEMSFDQDYQSCVQSFRKSAQLWTTYSGHYRKLRSVCHEEAMPFIRHNILDLFFNVTKLYTDFHSSAMESSQEAQSLHEELLVKLQNLVHLMDESHEHYKHQKEKEEKSYKEFDYAMVRRSESFEKTWDSLTTQLVMRSNQLERDFEFAQEKLQMVFDYINSRMIDVSASSNQMAVAHSQAAQSMSNDLASLLRETKGGHLVLQDLLNENLQRSSQVNFMLYDTQNQMTNLLDIVESESRAIVANITKEIREEALSIFLVLKTNIGDASLQLKEMGRKVTKTVFDMSAITSSLDTNLIELQEHIRGIKSFDLNSLFQAVVQVFKLLLCIIVGVSIIVVVSKLRQDRGGFLSAIAFGIITAYILKSAIKWILQ